MKLREAIKNFCICKVFVDNKKVEYKEELLDKEGVIDIDTDANCNSYFIFLISEDKNEV